MALVSSPVATDDTVLAAHHNQLRADLLTNHTHISGEGGTIPHSVLSDDAAISGTYLTHIKLNKHVQGTGTSTDPDSPGGNKGVHGLVAAGYVGGSLGYDISGSPTAAQLYVQAGSHTLSGSSVAVTFPVAFSTVISVVGCWTQAKTGGDNYPSDFYVTGVSTTGFTANSQSGSFYGATFNWIAVGTKT